MGRTKALGRRDDEKRYEPYGFHKLHETLIQTVIVIEASLTPMHFFLPGHNALKSFES